MDKEEVRLWHGSDIKIVEQCEKYALIEGLKRKISEHVTKSVGKQLQKGSIESLQKKYPNVIEARS